LISRGKAASEKSGCRIDIKRQPRKGNRSVALDTAEIEEQKRM
jgi:hypothetical protein